MLYSVHDAKALHFDNFDDSSSDQRVHSKIIEQNGRLVLDQEKPSWPSVLDPILMRDSIWRNTKQLQNLGTSMNIFSSNLHIKHRRCFKNSLIHAKITRMLPPSLSIQTANLSLNSKSTWITPELTWFQYASKLKKVDGWYSVLSSKVDAYCFTEQAEKNVAQPSSNVSMFMLVLNGWSDLP